MTEPDPDTVRGAIAGDQVAADALWRSQRPWVAAVLIAHKPNRAELDDLLQDVATRMVAHLAEVRDPRAFRPWLRAIALNVARSAGRRASAGPGMGSLHTLAEDPADPRVAADARRSEHAQRLERVMEILRGMHADYREPLMLRAVEGMTQRQIADVMGLPVTTIETRLARGRRMVRQAMDVRVLRRRRDDHS